MKKWYGKVLIIITLIIGVIIGYGVQLIYRSVEEKKQDNVPDIGDKLKTNVTYHANHIEVDGTLAEYPEYQFRFNDDGTCIILDDETGNITEKNKNEYFEYEEPVYVCYARGAYEEGTLRYSITPKTAEYIQVQFNSYEDLCKKKVTDIYQVGVGECELDERNVPFYFAQDEYGWKMVWMSYDKEENKYNLAEYRITEVSDEKLPESIDDFLSQYDVEMDDE